jgi:recombination protein RecA
MAKKDKVVEAEVEVKDDGSSIVADYIKKEFGPGVMKTIKDVRERKIEILKVCPSVNLMLGGGIPKGTWVNIAGRPKCGKTTTILWTCAKAQQMGMTIYYLNVEQRLKPMNAANLEEIPIDESKFHVIESTKEKTLSGKDFLNIGEKILLNTENSVVVIDSLAALVPEKEQEEGVGAFTRGGMSLLVAQFCRTMTAVVPLRNHIILTIQQIQANTSGYGAPTSVKGGNSIAYQGDIIMREKKVQDWNIADRQIGQKVTWEVDCTALGGFPGSSCESFLRYGKGIDETAEIVSLAKTFGLISGKNWLYFDFLEDHLEEIGETKWDEEMLNKYKANGEDKAAQYFKENPKIMAILEQELLAVTRP